MPTWAVTSRRPRRSAATTRRTTLPEVALRPSRRGWAATVDVQPSGGLAAEPVIRAVLPDANVPTSVRESHLPVVRRPLTDLDAVLHDWLARHPEGTACVIATRPTGPGPARVRRLTPELAKGLEFDLVVLVDPASYGEGVEGAVDRYVAMTRATQQLVLLTDG